MRKILVIDDDDTFRASVLAILRQQGYEVLEAADGTRGMVLACRERPDLILCDVFMEHTDGYTVLARLRENPATAAIPLILMTGIGGPEGMRHGMDLGADDYMLKPFSGDQLRLAIEARLKQQQVLREAAARSLTELRDNIIVSLPQELRTPLAGILGLADLILHDADELPRDVVGLVEDISQCGRRLQRLCENFLIYAQIELLAANPSERLALRQKQTRHAREFVKRLAQESAQAAHRADDLVLDLEAGHAAVSEELFLKLVYELLDNAFKFSPAHTPVKVATRSDADHFVLEVKDCGRGMESDEIAEVGAFMQFQRKIYGQTGTGLGLTIARRLAELHGGDLALRGAPDTGTTVTLRLPVPK